MSCILQGIFLNLLKVCRWVPSKSRAGCGIFKLSKHMEEDLQYEKEISSGPETGWAKP